MAALSQQAAEQLNGSVQSRLQQLAWVTGEDDTSLAEYIMLMLANAKTQDQIATELASDLLPDGTEGIENFAQWLFQEIAQLQGGGESQAEPTQSIPTYNEADHTMAESESIPAAYDSDMGAAPGNA